MSKSNAQYLEIRQEIINSNNKNYDSDCEYCISHYREKFLHRIMLAKAVSQVDGIIVLAIHVFNNTDFFNFKTMKELKL